MPSAQEQSGNPYHQDPDVLLMLEFQKGNNQAFEKLMHKYYKRLLNFIYRFMQNKQAAEDLTQEVFIRVFNSKQSYQAKSKFQTWAFTIAKNLTLNELRKNKRIVASLDDKMDGKEGTWQRQFEDTNSPRPDEGVLKKEQAAIIKEAMGTLPENQRMAIYLLRYDKQSYEEIAQTLGVSVSAVKSLLSRAKENLKIQLEHIINQHDPY